MCATHPASPVLVVKLLKCLQLGLLTMHTVQASVLIMRYRKEQKIYLLNCNSAGIRRTFPPQQWDPCLQCCNPGIKPRYLSIPYDHAVQPMLQVTASGGSPVEIYIQGTQ